MSGTNLEDTILKAIDIVVSKKISEAGYDKTIRGTIVSCEDPTIGKYKIRYQDSYFYAFTTNMDVKYSKGNSVYILVPGGDFRQQKTILGATEKLGVNYVAVAERDEAYVYTGENCIKTIPSWIKISSYFKNLEKQSKYLKIIYSSKTNTNNLLNINTTNLINCLKTSTSIICGGTIKTSFKAQQKERGNYGLIFRLSFKDNNTGKSIIRSYILDINKMTGNPYNYTNELRQYAIFNNIDGKNFERVEDISVFCYGFPNQTVTEKNVKDDQFDIFFSNIQLIACNKMEKTQEETYGLILQPSKIFFINDQDVDTKTITAEVRIKGKKADSSQNINYYWFVQDGTVVTDSPYFCQYGGRGWKCLNDKNVLQEEEKDTKGNVTKPAVYEWKSAKPTLTLKNEEILITSIKYKCVAVYDKTILEKEFEVGKLNGVSLSIVSDTGVNFYHDLGSPTLTCLIDGKEDVNNYTYEWSVLKADGYFNKLVEDAQKEEYQKKLQEYELCYDNCRKQIEDLKSKKVLKTSGQKKLKQLMEAEVQKLYELSKTSVIDVPISNEDYKKDMEQAKKKLRVYHSDIDQYLKAAENMSSVYDQAITYLRNSFDFDSPAIYKNKVYKIPIKTIVNYHIYKCAVYNKKGVYIGTASIRITNSLDKKEGFSLVITNGTQSFKYNEKGVAPTSQTLNNPVVLKPLSFILYDEQGREIINSNTADKDKIKEQLKSIKWWMPTSDTLLIPPKKDGAVIGAIKQKDTYYWDSPTLNYGIASSYNISYKNNNITLTIDYKGNILKAETNFSFLKQGEPGTNGTAYSCKIEPYVKKGTLIPYYPTIYIDREGNEYKFKDDNNHFNFQCAKHNGNWFRVKLFHNDELVFCSDGSVSKETASIKWSIVANKYSKGLKDNMALTIAEKTGICTVNQAAFKQTAAPACVIKAEVQYGRVIQYAYLPIVFSINKSNYKINLKDYTGFNLVVYTPDGRKPSYDNSTPHTLKVTQKINNIDEDITDNQGDYKLTYNWSLLGTSCWTDAIEAINAIKSNQKLTNKEKEAAITKLAGQHFTSDLRWNYDATLLKAINTTNYNYQFSCKPADDFSNLCVTNSVKCNVKQGDNEIGFIIMPVHMMLNQYGNAKINGWDGNAVNIDNQGGVILAPQVGAGRKEPDNTFTGVIIGEAKQNDSGMSKTYNGVLGFSKGRRSIYLDAQTGRAYFGVQNQGQIELIPDGDSTIGGWVIGQTALYSKGKDHFGPMLAKDAPVGAFLGREGKMDFTSKTGNYLRYDGENFRLNGGMITGGSIDIGNSFFWADSQRITFGSLVITEAYGRDALTVPGNAMAVCAKPFGTGSWWLWFSLHGKPVGKDDLDGKVEYDDGSVDDEEEDEEEEEGSIRGSSDPKDYALILNEGGQLYAQQFWYVDGDGLRCVNTEINNIWDQIWALWAAMEDDDEDED